MDHSFSLQLLIFLAAAVFVVPVAKRYGLGSVLGYLIAGVLIGPYCLGWVGGNEGDDIMHFSEIGIVMMLFLIGLEVDPKTLWRWRTSIVGLGSLQVGITSLLVSVIAYYLVGLPGNKSVAMGLIFSMSSTAIVLQTMNEHKWIRTDAGRKSFSVLLFQDIAVIVILALLPLLSPLKVTPANGVERAEFLKDLAPWLRTIVVIGSVFAIIIGGRFLTRPIFRLVASAHLNELFNAVALLIVLGITAVMTAVGLSPALGAFLAGVVLANSEYRHELESSIQPFKGLLLGMFFVAVGIRIDFDLIADNPLSITLSVLSVMILKLLILALLGYLFRMSKKQYLLFAFALAQVGEFAFVLLTFAHNQRIFGDEMFNLLMVIVAVSMAISPIFMLLFEQIIIRRFFRNRTEKEKAEDADEIHQRNNVIIAGYGRFGSVTGRFLHANGIQTTILDADSDRVEVLRKIGIKVYYGNALRIDLLKSAGADQAKLIVVALDDRAQILQLVNIVKKHFPQMHIIARAHGLEDAYDLMDAGVLHVYRETQDTSLRAGTDALKILGIRAYTAQRAADIFLKYDEQAMKNMFAARHNKKEYINVMRSRTRQLEALIQEDVVEKSIRVHTGKDMTDQKQIES